MNGYVEELDAHARMYPHRPTCRCAGDGTCDYARLAHEARQEAEEPSPDPEEVS